MKKTRTSAGKMKRMRHWLAKKLAPDLYEPKPPIVKVETRQYTRVVAEAKTEPGEMNQRRKEIVGILRGILARELPEHYIKISVMKDRTSFADRVQAEIVIVEPGGEG